MNTPGQMLEKSSAEVIDSRECQEAYYNQTDVVENRLRDNTLICIARHRETMTKPCTFPDAALQLVPQVDGKPRYVLYGFRLVGSCGHNYAELITNVGGYMNWI